MADYPVVVGKIMRADDPERIAGALLAARCCGLGPTRAAM